MKQRSRCAAVSSKKINELEALEERLIAACERAEESGYKQRAESYARQIEAVQRERERWSLLAHNPSPPAAAPHLFAAGLAVLIPLADLFIAGGHAARRLARLVLSIGLVVAAIIFGTSPPSAWEYSPMCLAKPVPWVREIAKTELLRKNFSAKTLHAHPLSPRALARLR